MTLKFKLTALAVMIASAVCSTAALASSWKIASGPDLGIRQIFEDAGTLVLQFDMEPAGNLAVTTPAGEELSNRRNGRYVVLTRFTHDFLVTGDAGEDRIVTDEIFHQEAEVRRAQRAREERERKEDAERQARMDAARKAAAAHQEAQSDALVAGSSTLSSSVSVSVPLTPTPPACEAQNWQGVVGSTLHDVVDAWTKKAGWILVWQPEIDYPMSAPVAFQGCYADAITSLFAAYKQVDHPFEVKGMVDQKTLVVSLRN